MESFEINHKNSRVSYYRFGSGPKLAICFHGYGENGAIFNFLAKYAGDRYTFYSIDLPFHGRTEWAEDLTLTCPDLQQIIEEILRQGNHKQCTASGGQTINNKLTIIGFSLGGRVALSLYQAIPGKIERVVLLAPDGLKTNFWYWLATQTKLGNRFFAFTMKKPGWFFGFLKLLNKLNMVNASIFKFVNYYIGDAEVRRLLYSRWTTLRKLKPNLEKIKKIIGENETQVRLIYGKHDRIILPSVGKKFRNGIGEYCTLTIIHSGHQVLHEKHAEEILPALLH